MTPTIIESPLAPTPSRSLLENIAYARACLYHSLSIGEAPIASHLLHPQVLDEHNLSHRKWGIEAGLRWYRLPAVTIALYTDFSISPGMAAAADYAKGLGLTPIERQLPPDILIDYKHGKFAQWRTT